MALQVVDTGISSAESNMSKDALFLEELDPQGKPILHLYKWEKPSATYGYFIQPEEHFDLNKVKEKDFAIARRPTGGGIIFHIWDLAFSFLMPSGHPAFSQNTLENYRFVNEAVLDAMRSLFDLKKAELIPEEPVPLAPACRNFCMAKPTQYDVVSEGVKVAGAAQRKRKQGYLHQGSISLAYPAIDFLKEVLLSEKEVFQAMEAYSYAPLGSDFLKLDETRKGVEQALIHYLMEKLASFDYSGSRYVQTKNSHHSDTI
jgi:lipoate---protein ligase